MNTTPESATDRAGFLLTEEAYYLLKQLHRQLKLISHLSASCPGQEGCEPALPIHAWFGCLENFAEQTGKVIDDAIWKPARKPQTR